MRFLHHHAIKDMPVYISDLSHINFIAIPNYAVLLTTETNNDIRLNILFFCGQLAVA